MKYGSTNGNSTGYVSYSSNDSGYSSFPTIIDRTRGRANGGNSKSRRQGVYWLLTIPYHCFTPYLPPACKYITGQLETGDTTGYLHWQILCQLRTKMSIRGLQEMFGMEMHAELSRSSAADDYVHKEETAVPGTRFTLGEKGSVRKAKRDWSLARTHAIAGTLDEIEADIYIRYYQSLRSIATDHIRNAFTERRARVFWGPTSTGKSTTAWLQAGESAYPKNPGTKWWDAYVDQENVVIDEFRGGVPIGDLLRWLVGFPVLVEVKGGHRMLRCRRIWITSNLSPEAWYPCCDPDTLAALMRRLEVYHFPLAEEHSFDVFE